MARRKFSPSTSACLMRLEDMERVKLLNGEVFEIVEGQRVYTPQEVAWVLGVSTTTVAALVKSGRLQGLNLSRVVRFLEDELMRFIGATHEVV